MIYCDDGGGGNMKKQCTILKPILLLLGTSTLSGCLCLTTKPINCPPALPMLPQATSEGVFLEPDDMRRLLRYFKEAETCSGY